MEKLAMVADALESIFPNGESSVLFTLGNEEFKSIQKHFREVDSGFKQFKIDISGIEMLFILDELLKDELDTSSETPS
jgi:hypothetical protein